MGGSARSGRGCACRAARCQDRTRASRPLRLTETAFAKLNLALHVRRRREDGYHDIETIFAFCEDGDQLWGEPADDLRLTLSGPFGYGLEGADNLVMRAAVALQRAAGVSQGAHLHLVKHLPVASGIGGGSADAAAALRLLARLWNTGDAMLPDIARDLGADVPACLLSLPMHGKERGDRLTSIEPWPWRGMPALLVNPHIPISTVAVFARWDGVDRGALLTDSPSAFAGGAGGGTSSTSAEGEKKYHPQPLREIAKGNRGWRNDLTDAAVSVVPRIADIIAMLDACPGSIFTRMSGSGATCFSLFEDTRARDAAEAEFQREAPDCWTLATRLRRST